MPELRGTILVIDDERGIRALVGDVLRRAGHQVEVAETASAGLAAVASRRFDLVLCDINLPDQDGVSLLPKLLDRDPAPTVILITAYPSIDTAVRGMKLGARDYLGKPFSPDELRLVVGRALAEDALRRDHAALRRQLALGGLLGDSTPMVELRRTIEKVGPSDATVLITGESGTGKELVARAVHLASDRAQAPFVPVNCGALVGSLLDSELFGHVRGAFTGADHAKRGLVVTADHGTLFLDEIAELPLELQPKLLRTLQAGEVKPVGGTDTATVDVRVVAATNRDLDAEIAAGQFRDDLFYRLAVITLEVPPLRARKDDIAPLARAFAAAAAHRARRGQVELADDAITWLEAQRWPGNVRELENTIERAVVLASGDRLGVDDVRPPSARAPAPAPAAVDAGGEILPLDELERRHILAVLDACAGGKTRAAALLGINRTTLWKKLRQYGLE
ncbi:MAG: sigma-54 dependent transcriptional regulator [Kofleriaceae bacterium]